MAFSQKLFTSLHNYSDSDTRIGELNRIWYDSNTNVFRIQLDAVTPGGTIIGGSGGGSSYTLPTATSSILGGVKIGSNITITNGVISVAAPFSGSYTDLTNKPTIPDAWPGIGTGSGLVVGQTSPTINSPTITDAVFQNTFSIGTQVFYTHPNGFSVNENFDITDPSQDPEYQTPFTGYHFTSGAGKTGVAFTLARTDYFTDGFGITGDASNNQFVIGSETANTDYVFKTGIGMPFDVSGGTTIFTIRRNGNLIFADSSTQTTAWTGIAPAGTLTGTTLNPTVVNSSLTSVGTLSSLAVTNSSATPVTVTYTPGTRTGVAILSTGKDTQGGTGYFDFLRATNTTSGATNPNKTFRLNSTGAIEIINSAYTTTLMSLSDTGFMSVKGAYQVGGKQAVNGPAFRAFVAVGQTITSGSQQKVTFGGETFDTDNCFGDSTYTFTPTLEGYYQFNATIRISGTAGTGEVMLVLYKNGSEYSRGTNESGTEQGANFYSMQISDIAYANGTTDNFELYIQQTSGASRTTTAGSSISHFSGCMIRGA